MSRHTAKPTVCLIIRKQLTKRSLRAFGVVFAPRRASDVEVRPDSSEALSDLGRTRISHSPIERTCKYYTILTCLYERNSPRFNHPTTLATALDKQLRFPRIRRQNCQDNAWKLLHSLAQLVVPNNIFDGLLRDTL